MAAARHILIMCGSAEIDGYAFCLGLEHLQTTLEDSMCMVTYLMRGAIFRPNHMLKRHERPFLRICPLGELLDMYHTHNATIRHDKLFALLGMSSDDLSVAGLEPNYSLPWKMLMRRLVKFILGDHVFVATWEDREMAVIKSKGYVLGKVSLVESSRNSSGKQNVEVIFNISNQSGWKKKWSAQWTLPLSAKPIQNGDLICLLPGASRPMIIRLRGDHFVIIMIAAAISVTGGEDIKREVLQPISFTRDFLLVWDWETFSELSDSRKCDIMILTDNWWSEYPERGLEGHLQSATKIWDVALILRDLGDHEKAEEKLREAIEGYEIALGAEYPQKMEGKRGLTRLSWAAGNGYDEIVDLLLRNDGVDDDLKDEDGQTPLSWAAWNGHEAVVKLLLGTGKVEADAKDNYGRTPLSWAAGKGHEAIVKLLLATNEVDIDAKDKYGRTPLSWAAGNGHEAMVKLLLATGKVDIDAKDIHHGRTPLSWGEEKGHEAVVKLLKTFSLY